MTTAAGIGRARGGRAGHCSYEAVPVVLGRSMSLKLQVAGVGPGAGVIAGARPRQTQDRGRKRIEAEGNDSDGAMLAPALVKVVLSRCAGARCERGAALVSCRVLEDEHSAN